MTGGQIWAMLFAIVLAVYCGVAILLREIRVKSALIGLGLKQQSVQFTEILRILRNTELPPRKPPTSVPPRRRSYDEQAAEYEFQHGPNKPPNAVEQAGIDALRSAQEKT
jgi:hypothetical protein